MLNVLVCHKVATAGAEDDDNDTPELDKETVQRHVVATSHEWFQILNPFLSDNRRQDIEKAFGSSTTPTTNEESMKSLSESYQLIFTETERESLTYEHFLEDWDAYVQDHPTISTTQMSATIAFDFLQEMQ